MMRLITILTIAAVLLPGCSATENGRRANIIEQLQDAGCIVSSYKERFGKSVIINC